MAGRTQLTVEERLDRTESHIEIADLVHGYARFIRRDQSEQVASLFARDAFFEVRDGHPDSEEFSVRSRIEGREQIDEYMTQGKGQPHPVPLIHNLSIEIDGDTASGNCVMEGQIYGTGHKVLGEYHDSFVRVEGRWLFASRTFTMFKATATV
ncbi:MAG: nuclear transport factor 2 family protein [Novosphingobium sp.]|nr:nuclear transport factor 2 family protein [Novosphingobium sp.]MCP5402121.1 nuclear transport factor 2 family protein [Novosphingobium sp.]